MEISLSSLKPPDGWKAYLVTFKDDDVHPMEKVSMKGLAVRIFAPEDEAAKIVLKARFGTAYYQLHDEKKMKPFQLLQYPNGIFETLHFHKVEQNYKLN
ncbi:MAG: hypothetical protein KAR20_19365 [Candidatus Heimdallarchaeota archaeon]|nr:hypothetical protein [Candidatus Heimdallarchaeota archaeon]